jgi:hypothetical protein
MLAERANLGLDQAFARLRLYARFRNLLLADVGRDFITGGIETGSLDVPVTP